MDKKRKKRKKTKMDRLAKALRPRPKKRFSTGGSGASLTKRQLVDVEMGVRYKLRLRVPPIRLAPDLDEKAFKRALAKGRTKRPRFAEEVVMTKEEFRKKLASGDYITRRRRRTITERRIAAMEYFERIEESWWVQQQLSLLYFFDKKEEKSQRIAYKRWYRTYAKLVAKATESLHKQGRHDEADEMQEFFAQLVEKIKPKRIRLAGLRYQIRKLALTGDILALRDAYAELQPLKEALKIIEGK